MISDKLYSEIKVNLNNVSQNPKLITAFQSRTAEVVADYLKKISDNLAAINSLERSFLQLNEFNRKMWKKYPGQELPGY